MAEVSGEDFYEDIFSDVEDVVMWPGQLVFQHLVSKTDFQAIKDGEYFEQAVLADPDFNEEKELFEDADANLHLTPQFSRRYAERSVDHDLEYGMAIADNIVSYLDANLEEDPGLAISSGRVEEPRRLAGEAIERMTATSQKMIEDGRVVYNLESVDRRYGVPGFDEGRKSDAVAEMLAESLESRGFCVEIYSKDEFDLYNTHVIGERF